MQRNRPSGPPHLYAFFAQFGVYYGLERSAAPVQRLRSGAGRSGVGRLGDGRAQVNTLHGVLRILLTILILFAGFQTMVFAFHLLNKPSDRAVYEGMAVLALLCVGLPVLLLRLWRRV
jgi:hypothetical protein